ncbi:uncharacterized protein LOC114178092 isoform X2 [Vigna unguiculata]|uniref:uncharacterized protein LOC114177788 isoform X2 n=1 Tax=Vigna unguiculata TaxID=3917 RepID=UPI00101665FD|nr:uncharacterized protein LOC114177788 isoform X2 [Vigna unguiculata]XP_027919119.1 uncharacterized protein LOC114177788 isoform X2 [Vigna unguiculata]XP_027919599.1 uncharacterized protein LOC114178092 isoform X2 [Vigna unguiculata]XP_027919600.1 uncharacterized protein LOC114178092 isoform X2 [Vigna unguiculata]
MIAVGLLNLTHKLDLCSKMAKYLARSSTPFALRFPESFCMDCCCFSNFGAYNLGILVDCDIGSRSDWVGCNNGWYCPSIGFLFNYAVVENSVAKLKKLPANYVYEVM